MHAESGIISLHRVVPTLHCTRGWWALLIPRSTWTAYCRRRQSRSMCLAFQTQGLVCSASKNDQVLLMSSKPGTNKPVKAIFWRWHGHYRCKRCCTHLSGTLPARQRPLAHRRYTHSYTHTHELTLTHSHTHTLKTYQSPIATGVPRP